MNIPIITGATASGKTGLAIEIAKHGDYEIISADSRQVYKECDIATAKPDAKELKEAVHHLLSHVDVQAKYSAGMWCADAIKIIDDIEKRGKKALICGGTPFYIYSLVNGLFDDEGFNSDERDIVRKNLINQWETNKQEMYEKLEAVDINFAKSISPNDKQRVIRGLEIYQLTQKPLSDFFSQTIKWTQKHKFEVFIIDIDRKVLYERINKRVDIMMEKGLKNEVETLYNKYGDFKQYNGLNTVGYVEWLPFFDKQCLEDCVIEEIKKNSRRFAKRQETFFKNKFVEAQRLSIDKIRERFFAV